MPVDGAATAVAAPHAWGWRPVALVMAGCLFMLNLDSSIIATSLPQIAADFHRPAVALSIGISAYILAGAAVVPLSGWLADRLGTRQVLLGALGLFTAASIACGLATSFWPFVLARVVQGAGGAIMMPVGQSVVLRRAEGRLIEAMSLVVWPALIAPVLGPALGGFITTFFTWRWNFWLNLPLGLGLAGLIGWIMPDYRGDARRRLDLTGLGLTSLAMVCGLAGLDLSAGSAARPRLAAALIGGGAGLGWLAVRHLKRNPAPLLSLAPLRLPTFRMTFVGPGLVHRMVFAATPLLLPLLFQLCYHLSAAGAGLLVLVYFSGNLAMKSFTTPIMRRFGFRPLLIANGLLAAATLWGCALLRPDLPRPLLMGILFVAGSTRSLQFTLLLTLGFSDIGGARKGDATTLSSLVMQGTFAAGIALAAVLLRAVAGGHPPGPADFRVIFEGLAVLCAVAALWFLRLPPGAGEHVRRKPGPG